MNGSPQNLPEESPRDIILKAIAAIRAANNLLLNASRATSNPNNLAKIQIEHSNLNALLNQLSNIYAIADDALFANATNQLKNQASALQNAENYIKQISNIVETAAQIAGYIAQAATFIAKL